MPRNRFVDPDTKRLDMSDGDWIEVKTRLSWGDTLLIQSSSVKGANFATDEVSMDLRRSKLTRFFVWLTDWSFTDGAGKRVKLTMDALEALEPDDAEEIDEVLTVHIEAIEASKKAIPPGKT